MLTSILRWFRNNDLPNWFTAVIWPVFLYLWFKRTRRFIPALEVTLSLAKSVIPGASCPYLDIVFFNNTGTVVYLTHLRASNIKPLLQVHEKASMDIVSHSYQLKFLDERGVYLHREITLNTGHTAKTGLPLSNIYDGENGEKLLKDLTSHRRSNWRTKYFALEYTALVGERKYKVNFGY